MRTATSLEVVRVETVENSIRITAIPAGLPQQPMAGVDAVMTTITMPRTAYFAMGAPREGEQFTLGATAH